VAKLCLFANASHLSAMRSFVTQTGRALGLEHREVIDLQLAVDEACTNVIEHAYQGCGGEIEVTVEAVEDGIRAVVRDWGAAFDPEAVPVPDITLPLEQRPLGGLGLYLMRKVMDHVDFRFEGAKGNTLTMIKHLTRRTQ
jgi:anti-sigma regulatory factor (Ser/Thr protein kinase)